MTAPLTASRRLPVVVLVLVLVLSGLVIWRTARDGRPAAKVGSVVAAADPITGGERVTVRVPNGEYDVRAVVRDDVPDDLAVRSRQAPDGGSFVGISMVRTAAEPFLPTFARASTAPKEPTGVLVADGRRYPLAIGSDDDLTTARPVAVYVAVAGDARSLRLEVTWAGRKQSVDLRTGAREAGAFAPLYRADLGASELASCGTVAWPAGDRADVGLAASCDWAADRLPYVPGRGWARSGQEWLVLRVVTTPPAGFVHRIGARDVRYYSRSALPLDGGPRHRLDGRAPLATYRFNFFTDSRGDALLYSVPTGSTAHTATFVQRVEGFARTGDDVITGTQTWTVRV